MAEPLTTQLVALSDTERKEARAWMQAARAWLLEKAPYLDTALTSMVLVERDDISRICVDRRWRLSYNPTQVLAIQAEHGIAMLASHWVHGVMHMLRIHSERWQALREVADRIPIYNQAADAFVNADCTDLNLPLPTGAVTFATLPKSPASDRTMSTEMVYFNLLQQMDPEKNQDNSDHDCGSGVGGGQREWEQSLDDDQEDGSVGSDREQLIQLETAHKVVAASRLPGTVPKGMLRWASEFVDPVVDWRRELRSVVSRHIGQLAGTTDYTFARPARRRTPGYTLPGMARPTPPRVAVVIDTSGSMSPDDLALCLSDLLGLSRSVSASDAAIAVIACDAQAHPVQYLRRPAGVQHLQLTGGGGTDLREGIDAVVQLRPRPEVVVVLTDGYTPWPEEKPPALRNALFVALLTEIDEQFRPPQWMRAIEIGERARSGGEHG